MCYSALVKRDLDYLNRQYGAIAIREQIDDYTRAAAVDPKRFPPPEPRIFPGHYAPVIFERDGKRVIELMRYGAYPPPTISNPKAYTTFNARRDNLTSSFWAGAFMRHHGFVVLDGFYEWVSVNDLLRAGVVKLKDVEAEFHRQAEERNAKILAAGKKYKPTPTELKDPRLRQIIIEFKPDDGQEMLAPVIFSYGKGDDGPGGKRDVGFAIVTDDPPLEIEQAGHDRCPVILEPDAVEEWLEARAKAPEVLLELLGKKKRVTFRHKLAEAA